MATTLKDIRDHINAELQDDARFLTPDEKELYIVAAINQVDNDRPLRKVADITGDGSQDYGLPADFEKGFSIIQSVESPAGEIPPNFLREDDSWFEYEDPTKSPALRLKFFNLQPTSSDIIRINYTAPYTVTTDASDLDRISFLSVVYKALEFALAALGQKFTQSSESTLLADSVNYAARGQNFIFQATEWGKKYKQVVGIGQDNIAPAQAFKEKDITYLHGEDMIFHQKRFR